MVNFRKLIKYTLIFLIFGTLNLKADWIKIQTIPAPFNDNYWLEVFFLPTDANYGWICGFNGNVIRTTDGGLTWQGVKIPGAYQLESIHFANDSVGYTSGGGLIYKSIDGGATWKDISGIISANQIAIWGNFFINENEGCVVGGGCDILGEQYFFRTTDGGNTWDYFIGNVENTGMTDVTIIKQGGLAYAVSSGYLWKSSNGGISWSVFSRSGNNDWQEDLHLFGNSILVPYSGSCGGGDEFNSGIRMSVDGGINWKQFRTGKSMFGSFLIDEKRGWACGFKGSIYYTSDGGDHWTLRDCGIDKNKDLDDIWFINDSTGFLVGDGAVYKSFTYDTLKPTIEAIGPVRVCEGEEVTLTTTEEFPNYLWSTGDRSRSITVNKTGSYTVKVFTVECDSGRSNCIEVKVLPKPKPKINIDGPDTLCEGEPATLTLDKDYSLIEWGRGETGKSIEVTEAGTYTVSVTDSNGCMGAASKSIYYRQRPKPPLIAAGKTKFCTGDSTVLKSVEGYTIYRLFLLNDGSKKHDSYTDYIVRESGKYYMEVVDRYGCIGWSDTLEIIVLTDSNRYEITFNAPDNTLDFDSVSLTDMKCIELKIRNNSEEPKVIDDIFVFRNIEFSLKQSVFPVTVPPLGTVTLEVCYSPSLLGRQYDTLLLFDVCNPHLVKLKGSGSPNYYNGENRCSLPMEIKTTRLNKPKFLANPPFPNPIKEILMQEFGIYVPKAYRQEITAGIYDIFGNRKLTGDIIYDSETKTDSGTIYYGRIIFDASQLQSGNYYIKAASGTENFTYPVVKY